MQQDLSVPEQIEKDISNVPTLAHSGDANSQNIDDLAALLISDKSMVASLVEAEKAPSAPTDSADGVCKPYAESELERFKRIGEYY